MLSSRDEEKYDFWDPAPLPEIPGRSTLYSLPAIGLGTSQVECLTSYMSRPANAHNLSVSSMFTCAPMSREISVFQELITHDVAVTGCPTGRLG